MAVKLRVKVGSIELDYEGSEDWLKEGLPNLITNVSELQRLPGSMAGGFPPPENAGGKSSGQLPSNGTSDFQMSVENVSHKINAKEGTDLIRAAAAYLTLVERKNTFSRKELLDAMKSWAARRKPPVPQAGSQMVWPGLGLGTWVQVVPFQCTVRVCSGLDP